MAINLTLDQAEGFKKMLGWVDLAPNVDSFDLAKQSNGTLAVTKREGDKAEFVGYVATDGKIYQ